MVHELTFRKHIVNICGKAFQNLELILVFSYCRSENVMQSNRSESSRIDGFDLIPMRRSIALWWKKKQKIRVFLYLQEYGVYPLYPLIYSVWQGMFGWAWGATSRLLAAPPARTGVLAALCPQWTCGCSSSPGRNQRHGGEE